MDTPGDDHTLVAVSRGEPEADNGHHIDIRSAEATFNQLSRALTQQSIERRSSPSSSGNEKDPEKGGHPGDSQEEPFDLREYLSSSNDANQSAGIKHKHVGVTWENLQVEVFGSADFKIYVETFGRMAPIFIIILSLD